MIAELLAFFGLLIFGGLLGVVSGVSLARLGRRGEAKPSAYPLAPWLLVLGVVAIYLVNRGLSELFPETAVEVAPIRLALAALVLITPVLLFRILGKAPGWFQKGQIHRRFTWAIRVWLCAMPGFLAVVLLNDFLFNHWIPWTPGPDPLLGLSSLSTQDLALSALFLCILLPILEEALFRGYLFRGLVGARFKLSSVRAIAISSLIFALAHQPDLWLPMLYLGCLLAWLDWRGADLRLCMMAHIAHNSFFFAIALI